MHPFLWNIDKRFSMDFPSDDSSVHFPHTIQFFHIWKWNLAFFVFCFLCFFSFYLFFLFAFCLFCFVFSFLLFLFFGKRCFYFSFFWLLITIGTSWFWHWSLSEESSDFPELHCRKLHKPNHAPPENNKWTTSMMTSTTKGEKNKKLISSWFYW